MKTIKELQIIIDGIKADFANEPAKKTQKAQLAFSAKYAKKIRFYQDCIELVEFYKDDSGLLRQKESLEKKLKWFNANIIAPKMSKETMSKLSTAYSIDTVKSQIVNITFLLS